MYDFTTFIDRRGSGSIPADPPKDSVFKKGITEKAGCDPIPMWVAELGFKTCPSIVDALKK